MDYCSIIDSNRPHKSGDSLESNAWGWTCGMQRPTVGMFLHIIQWLSSTRECGDTTVQKSLTFHNKVLNSAGLASLNGAATS